MDTKLSPVNITSSLRITEDTQNGVMFNPSIAWIRDNFYLLTVRNFRRYRDIKMGNKLPEEYHPDPIFNPQHPWLGGIKSETWWASTEEDGNVSEVYVVELAANEIMNVQHLFTLDAGDIRPHRISETEYKLIGYDLRYFGPEHILADGTDCFYNSCTSIIVTDVHVYRSAGKWEHKIINTHDAPCLAISNRTEKHWSLFKYNSILYYSYMLTPRHTIVNANTCEKTVCPGSNFLRSLELYYPGSAISLSSQIIEFESGRYLSMGHFKIPFSLLDAEGDITPFQRWLYERGSLETCFYVHTHVYFAFFYVFEAPTLEVVYLSPSFMVTGFEPYPLCFPAGLAYNPLTEMLVVSYSECDTASKLVHLRLSEALEMCTEIDEYTPETYPFDILE